MQANSWYVKDNLLISHRGMHQWDLSLLLPPCEMPEETPMDRYDDVTLDSLHDGIVA